MSTKHLPDCTGWDWQPQKPPELWNPTAEEKVLLWGAIHNMQAAIGRVEAQLKADASRDPFFESGL